MKTEKQVNDILINFDSSKSKYRSMTYEQGIEEALQWVLGEIDDDEFSPLFDKE